MFVVDVQHVGAKEGVVAPYKDTTRGLPVASKIARMTISRSGSNFTVTVENTSAAGHAITTPLSPVFWAIHDQTWKLFTMKMPDAGKGLENIAEDGSTAQLVASATGAAGVGSVGAAAVPVGASSPGPITPGGMYRFTVTPTAAHRRLTIASMVVESNDAFISFPSDGVDLLDSAGAPRSDDQINGDINRLLAVWDAGTEANEVPGAGVNQKIRQAADNQGPADPFNMVRLYSDATNDLAGPHLGGFARVTVVTGTAPLSFNVTVENTSAATPFPGVLTPVVWAVHDANARIFMPGMPASEGLERVAEDGNPMPLATALSAQTGVGSSGVAAIPVGGSTPGPIMPGGMYRFDVTANAGHPFLSIASMVVPSNDTFMAFSPAGIPLLDSGGQRRADAAIAADIATQLAAWDAGTERNQAGAAGADQAPRQAAPNTGANEGSSKVRRLDDSTWDYPAVADTVKVTIHPMP